MPPKRISFSVQSKYYEYDESDESVDIMNVDTKTYDGSSELCDLYAKVVVEYFSKFLNSTNLKNVIARLMDNEIVDFILEKTKCDITAIDFIIYEIDYLIEKLTEISQTPQVVINERYYMMSRENDDPMWDTPIWKKKAFSRFKKTPGFGLARHGHRNYSQQIPCAYLCHIKLFREILGAAKEKLSFEYKFEEYLEVFMQIESTPALEINC